jgi:hypothetical protein
MMGLEPTTFCMARTMREATGDDTSRHLAQTEDFSESRGDMGCRQPTAKASQEASQRILSGLLAGDPVLIAVKVAVLPVYEVVAPERRHRRARGSISRADPADTMRVPLVEGRAPRVAHRRE